MSSNRDEGGLNSWGFGKAVAHAVRIWPRKLQLGPFLARVGANCSQNQTEEEKWHETAAQGLATLVFHAKKLLEAKERLPENVFDVQNRKSLLP